jgi:hypothetical protein
MNNRGQFSIIAALLVAIVLIGTLIAVYAMIRYDSSQNQTPQSLTATDETNLAIQKALGFTVGYYGSMLQVTGNQTYADANATAYMKNALQYIESMNPSWGESISMTSLNLKTDWFTNPSVSEGQISVVYDLTNLGISNITYTISCSLGVQIFKSLNSNQVCLNVTQDSTEPLTSLGQQNFAFYDYNYATSDWRLINPSLTPIIFTNGTYLINPPSGIDDSAFMVQVTDSRGIMVEASSFNSYNLDFTFGSQSITQNSPIIVQLLQNGTLQTFGQDLVNTTQTLPIPPVPVKALNLCQTGSTSDIPFQVEDWASNYMIPLGLTSNYTIFSNSQMIVFEVTPSTSQLTLWWNGSDTATQPSAAYTDKYFDDSSSGTLSNGNIVLNVIYNNGFQIQTVAGKVTSTATFMRVNKDAPTYGSGPSSIILNGTVRDIVEEEAEWGENSLSPNGGVPNCPNVYSQIVITLPANANYYTYQLRTIFITSTKARTVTDLSPLQLTTSISNPQAMTENGTLNGIPIVSNSNGYFNNSTDSAHHWSELINNNLQGTGIMFTDSANQQLYAFDSMAGKFTGALYVNSPTIELDPVTPAGPVPFTIAKDLTWYGAVATFNGANPIYASSGNYSLWSLAEQPPTVTITPQSSPAASITLSPSSGNVGTSVTASGGGFLSNSQITIAFNGIKVKTVTATSYGAIPSGTTFTVPSSPYGSCTVTATDTSSNSASAIFTLTPLDHFAVTTSGGGSIGTQTAGTPFSITITAENSTGYTVTSYTGTNTLTVSSGTISPTSTGAFTAGVWTGSVTLSTSGSGITIGTTASSKSGTSNAFTVNPGAATHFVVSGFPSPTTAGAAHSVTVTAYDAYGNVATGYAGTVKITSSDTQAVLPANAGLTNGVGTFSVTLKTAGTQSITANDTVTSSITGSQTGITVNAGALATITVSGPASVTAGGTATFTATGYDAYGNSLGTETASWSIQNGAGGSWSSNVYTSHTSGTWTVTATVGSIRGTATLTVNPGSLHSLSVSLNPSTVTAGSTSTATATGYDSCGNSLGTEAASWSIQNGAGGSWSSNVYTSYTAGSWTVTATVSGIQGTATLTVNPGSLSSLSVSLNPSTVTAGSTTTATATGYDSCNNNLGTETATWSISSGAGGSWSHNVYTSHTSGTWTVTATVGSVQGTATLTVNVGSLHSLSVSLNPSTVTAGSTSTATATGYDSCGNSLGTETATWSIQNGAGGSWSSNVYTSHTSGTWTVTATVGSVQGTATLTVNVGSLYSVSVSLNPSTVTAGSTTTATATGYDSCGNSLGTETATWSISSGAGGSWSSNVYTSHTSGTWTVTATVGSVQGTATLTVNVGSLYSLTVTLSPSTVTAGGTTTATDVGYDSCGNSLGSETSSTTWSILSGAHGSWSSNVYTSYTSGSWTVTGTVGSIQGTATLTVNVGSLHSLTVTLSPSTVTAGGTTTATDVGDDSCGNSLGSETSSTTWSIQSGAGGSWSSNVYTSHTMGSWTVTATIGSIQGTTTLTVNFGTLVSLTVTLNPSTVTAGQTTTATDVGYDSCGNSQSETSSTSWSISSSASGSWSANVYTSHTSGSWTVTGTIGSVQGTASLAVNVGSLYSLTVTLTPSTVTAGGTTTATDVGYDSCGNSLGSETSSTTWSIQSGAGGSWSSNVYTSHTSGTWTVTATVGSVQGTATLTVNPGALDHFTVTASGGGNIGTQTENTPFSITVTAYDVYGNVETGYSGPATLSDLASAISPTSTGTFTNGAVTLAVAIMHSYTNDRITATGSSKTGQSNQFNVNILPIALDGSPTSGVNSGSTITMTLTTSDTNDLLYLSVTENNGVTVQNVTSSGLTWSHRATATYSGSSGVRVETWYAICPATGSISITITLSSNSYSAAAVAYAIKGANIASPFDGSAVTTTGTGSPATDSITTTNNNDFIIGAVGVNTNPSITVSGTSFNLISTKAATDNARETSDQYRVVSSTGTYSPSWNHLSGNNWAIIVDAIKQGS